MNRGIQVNFIRIHEEKTGILVISSIGFCVADSTLISLDFEIVFLGNFICDISTVYYIFVQFLGSFNYFPSDTSSRVTQISEVQFLLIEECLR